MLDVGVIKYSYKNGIISPRLKLKRILISFYFYISRLIFLQCAYFTVKISKVFKLHAV